MLSKRLFLLSPTFLVSVFTIKAQETDRISKQFFNTVKLATASVHIPHETGNVRPFGQVGIFYERKIAGNWVAGIGYMQWLTVPNGTNSSLTPAIGELCYRSDYKMLDLYGAYTVAVNSHHLINLGFGLSNTWGLNCYYTNIIIDRIYFHETHITEERKESFLSLVPQLTYNYHFFNNRFQLGADIRYRSYLKNLTPQIDLGAHIGFMF